MSACYFPFSFFLIFSLDVGDPERESYGAQVAPQIKTPPGPSMFFFFVRFFTSTDAHSLILSPLLFFPTCTHAHEHVMFFYSPSIPTETILSFFFSFSLSLFQTFCFFFIMMMMGKGIERRGKKGEVLRVSAGAPDLTSTSPINFCYILSRSIFLNFIFKFFTAIKLIYLLG